MERPLRGREAAGSSDQWRRERENFGRRKAASSIDAKSAATLWRHLALAAEDGRWKALDYGDAPAACGAAEVDAEPPAEIQDSPRGEVESCDGERYKWRGFWKEARSADDAYDLFNAEWHEQQRRHAHVKQMEKKRKEQVLAQESEDARHARGSPMTLRHPYYKKEFRGHHYEEGSKVTFVEDTTSLRVSLGVPTSDRATRSTTTWRENQLYNAARRACQGQSEEDQGCAAGGDEGAAPGGAW